VKTIIVTAGTLMGGVYPVDRELIIGRDNDCDIQLMDPSSSRRHASIVSAAGDTVLLKDLDSQNGTQVEDEPVSEQHLSPGDSFTIGHVTFDYLVVGESQVESARPGEVHLLSGPDNVASSDAELTAEEVAQRQHIASAVTVPPPKKQ
jgi:pSer/pThr/pTyr-binding forkhead associated (FHA) protein